MKRVSSGKYELHANGHHYEVMRRNAPIIQWYAFRDKVNLGNFSTYKEAKNIIHTEIEQEENYNINNSLDCSTSEELEDPIELDNSSEEEFQAENINIEDESISPTEVLFLS